MVYSSNDDLRNSITVNVDIGSVILGSVAGGGCVVVLVVVKAWRNEEDKICRVKKSPFSKQVGVVLER